MLPLGIKAAKRAKLADLNGHDPQRSGWADQEDVLSAGNVSGMKLLWKTQIKNEARSLASLTAPIVAVDVTTPTGVRNLVYVAGSSEQYQCPRRSRTGELVWRRESLKLRCAPEEQRHVALSEQSECHAHD